MTTKSKLLLCGSAVVICGVLCGIFMPVSMVADFERYIDVLVNAKTTVAAAVLSNTVFVAAVFLLGYVCFGFVLIYPMLFFRAFCAAFAARLCIQLYGAYGAFYILAFILPVSAITLLLMTLMASQSVEFSFSLIFGGERADCKNRLVHHTVFGLTFILLSGFAVLWSVFLNPVVAMVI